MAAECVKMCCDLEGQGRGYFLNVPGNQFLLDILILVIPLCIIPFVAFLFLLIFFPEVFSTYDDPFGRSNNSGRRTFAYLQEHLQSQSLLSILQRLTNSFNDQVLDIHSRVTIIISTQRSVQTN